jgi:hypothetical protein
VEVSLLLSDEELALFAKMPRRRLEAIVALVARTGDDFEADLVAMLELAEKMQTPGCIKLAAHHDARGRVNSVEHTPEWHRRGRKSA